MGARKNLSVALCCGSPGGGKSLEKPTPCDTPGGLLINEWKALLLLTVC